MFCIEAQQRCVECLSEISCADDDPCTTDICLDGRCANDPIPDCGDNREAPPDEDGDGVPDEDDLCPGTPPGESVNGVGCSCRQLDGDRDGVNHCNDRCPDTPAGQAVGPDGCPLRPEEPGEPGEPGDGELPPGGDVGTDGLDVGALPPDGPIGSIPPSDGEVETPPGATVTVGPGDAESNPEADEAQSADEGSARRSRSSNTGLCGTVGLLPLALFAVGMSLMRSRRPRI